VSGVAGLFHRSGRPLEPAALERMVDLMTHRGPDARGVWSDGHVGLGHCLLRTTPESLHERQPLSSPDAGIHLVFDGRIDNRSDLARALDAPSTATDSDLVLLAYARWGRACPSRLVGEFALAIWDGRARHLFCARDPSGLRPLLYFLDRERFVFGSEPQQLVRGGGVPARPHEPMVAEHLACALTNQTETLLRDVLRLSPGFTFTVSQDRAALERYWHPSAVPEVRAKNDGEYAEQFRAVFGEAVRCRLRASTPVAIYLSGGLDSSAIALTAQQIAASRFDMFTLTFPGHTCDERHYAQAVAGVVDAPWFTIDVKPTPPSMYWDQARQYLDQPLTPNGMMIEPVNAAARARGARVALTGLGGDEWFDSAAGAYGDLAMRLRFVALARLAWQNRRDRDFSALAMLRLGLWPLLPGPARRAISRGLRGAARRPKTPPWIDPAFAKRVGLEGRLCATPPPLGLRTRALEHLCQDVASAWGVLVTESADRWMLSFGLEVRCPLHDRRVVELAIGLPEDQRRRGATTKWVIRQAVPMPHAVRARSDKADFSHVILESLATWPDGDGASAAAQAGWVVPRRLRRLERRLRERHAAADPRYMADAWRVWMVRATDLWLRALQAG
jgi:asparagine synthase (glutamine-hydrolysing)